MKILRLIPCDGTFDQVAPLRRLSKLSSLRSFDLSSATDRFPLAVQGVIIEALSLLLLSHGSARASALMCSWLLQRRIKMLFRSMFGLLLDSLWDICLLGRCSRFAITLLCGIVRKGRLASLGVAGLPLSLLAGSFAPPVQASLRERLD